MEYFKIMQETNHKKCAPTCISNHFTDMGRRKAITGSWKGGKTRERDLFFTLLSGKYFIRGLFDRKENGRNMENLPTRGKISALCAGACRNQKTGTLLFYVSQAA